MSTASTMWTGLRAQAGAGGVLGVAVLSVAVVGTAVAGVLAWPLVFPPAEKPAPTEAVVMASAERDELARKGEGAVRQAKDRVSARSPFYPKVVAPPPPPPAPLSYGGPSLIAILGDEAWFSTADRLRLKPGDPEVNGLVVVSLDAPWSATVIWRGGQFTLELFKRDAFKPDSALDWLNSASGMLAPTDGTPSEAGDGSHGGASPTGSGDGTVHVAPTPIPPADPAARPSTPAGPSGTARRPGDRSFGPSAPGGNINGGPGSGFNRPSGRRPTGSGSGNNGAGSGGGSGGSGGGRSRPAPTGPGGEGAS
jgi:hypothetical protein